MSDDQKQPSKNGTGETPGHQADAQPSTVQGQECFLASLPFLPGGK